ncbi:molybdenum cofactor synthesis domain protein [Methanothermus fervidus DSM 2088]|uniref:Molybdenum cofactor synthesis domain protein n=1 Tax=Methanothermus fervidus (strain ATCC 43054 / DSM 2088 / JCM 10308 / V24 S) TaxID=523846 RepID=E3GY27_METFV|nr:gephyrin-like molybdotransferase Glp [Methanothermus fervidus]ADP77209.1 molybdenum cofactor synthesis domain protein [Methanothermus fervidus DSM 2088]
MFFTKLFSINEVYKILEKEQKILDLEVVRLENAYKRICAKDIVSKLDSPPFDRAAMDGYAVKAEDTFQASEDNPVELKVIDRISAGSASNKKINSGEAIKVNTGAPLPPGANAVIMEEYVLEKNDDKILITKRVTPLENVSLKGEDIKRGDKVIKKGQILRSQELGALASAGYSKIEVYKRPKVNIIVTGDELVEPKESLKLGEIINSNKYIMLGMVKSTNAIPNVKHCNDNPTQLKEMLLEAKEKYDLIITTGGTAVSESDIVVDTVDEIGKVFFHGTAIQPGKAMAFGKIDGTPIFMLSGYPVAAMVQFDIFVRPYLLRMQGIDFEHQIVKRITKKKIISSLGRTTFVRGIADDKYVTPILSKGSGIIRSMVKANCYIVVDENVEGIYKGEECDVILFNSFTLGV